MATDGTIATPIACADENVVSLEPGRAQLTTWIAELTELGLGEIEQLDTLPAVGLQGDQAYARAAALSLPIGEAPLAGGMTAVARHVAAAARVGLLPSGPGYLAYIPGGGLPSAAMADLLAGLLNRFTGLAAAAPALLRLEQDVLRWLADAFGLPETARGLLTSGGSLANLIAVTTARHARCGDSGDYRHITIYTSAQAHHSIAKAVKIAGIPSANLRAIAVDRRLRMDANVLAQALAQDRRAGFTPLMVISSAGTTNTGAIDPLNAIADVCVEESVWHHVDGAYGGAFVLCDEGRARLAGIDRADSITMDPHKGMFLPYGTGCLLVRDGAILRAAHHQGASYLHDFDAYDRSLEPHSPNDYGPELSRDYRGLRLWLPLQLHGAGAFRAALSEKLALAQTLHDGLAQLIRGGAPIELLDPEGPQLSVVSWRLARREGEALVEWNRRNLRWNEAINARARVHLSSSSLPTPEGPAVFLRACVLAFRTHLIHVQRALEDLAATLACGTDVGST